MKKTDTRYPVLFPAAGLLIVYASLRYGGALSDILFPDGRTLWPDIPVRLLPVILLFLLYRRLTGSKRIGFPAGPASKPVWRASLPVLLMMFLLAAASAAVYARGGSRITAEHLLRLPAAAVFCVLVGLMEELAFRVLPYHGILLQLRSKKQAYICAAILNFVFFGAAHIAGAEGRQAFTEPLGIVCLLLRFAETGLFGLVMLRLYVWSGDAAVCSAVHAVFDFTALLPSLLFSETFAAGSPVRVGSTAVILYAVMTAVLLLLLIRLRKAAVG